MKVFNFLTSSTLCETTIFLWNFKLVNLFHFVHCVLFLDRVCLFSSAKGTKSRKKRLKIWRWWNLLKSSQILEVFNFWPKNFQKQQMLKTQKFFSELQIYSKTCKKILVDPSWIKIPLRKIPGPTELTCDLNEIDIKCILKTYFCAQIWSTRQSKP